MKGPAGTPITCHRFTTPLLTGSQPPAVPGQDLPPHPHPAASLCPLCGDTGTAGVPCATGRCHRAQGSMVPGTWWCPQAEVPWSAFPSPACDWGHVTSRSPPWCPCGIRDAPVWLPGKQQGPKIPPRGMQGLWARSPGAEQAQPCPHPDVAVGCTAPHPPGASVSVPAPSPCPSVPSPGPWCHRWHWNIPACTPGVREGWWRGEGDLGVLGPLGAPL